MSSNGTATKPEEGAREKPGAARSRNASCTAPPAVVSPGSSGTGHPAERKLATLLHPSHDRPKGAHEPVIPARCALRKDALTSARVFPGLLEPLTASEFRSTSCRGGGSCFRLTRLEAARMPRVPTTRASTTLTVATVVLAATWGIGFHCAENLRNVRRRTARTVGELANFVRYYREAAASILRYRLDCCGSWRIRPLRG